MNPVENVEPQESGASKPLFFPVSTRKLLVMSTVTFGLYEIFWFYKNWKLVKERTGENIMPFWRGFFGVIFCHACFREMREASEDRGLSKLPLIGWLTLAWILLTISWRLPDPYWLITWLSPLVLVRMQKLVNELNSTVAPSHDPNDRYSRWNIAGIVVGGILLVLTIIGIFLPDDPSELQ